MEDQVEAVVPEVSPATAFPAIDIYVGSNKVAPVTLDNGLISVQLDDIEVRATAEQFEAMKSATPYEDGLVGIRKWRPTIAKILTILTQDNLTMMDKDFVIQRVDMSILENYRSATAKLFGVDLQEKVSMQQIIDIVSPAEKKS